MIIKSLIYSAIFSYLLAFVLSIAKRKKSGQFIYFAGFLISAAAFLYRWYIAGHIPFQNMFEIFLSMGIFVYPLSIFSRRFLDVDNEESDMLIGAILLFPAGFIFNAKSQMLPPALQSPLFIPHVAVYLISYVIMAKACVQALCQLKQHNPDVISAYEDKTYKMICLGFPLLTLGLILGSWWGKIAWGDYWGWDPKELWSLASWLIYVLYFHFRYIFGKKYARINGIIALAGFAAIMITLLWVNLSRIFISLHSYAA